MIGLERPLVPDTYFSLELRRKIREWLKEVRRWYRRGQPRAMPSRGELEGKWKQFRPDFREAQHQKCAYCETKLTNQEGDVDHFAPKGRVEAPVYDHPGSEMARDVTVRGRLRTRLFSFGYWWLTYEWSNWLIACKVCNLNWKHALFPVKENPHPTPHPLIPYTPLLLNPFEVIPERHLGFDENGVALVLGLSQQGRATIDTVGLNRPSLIQARAQQAKMVQGAINRLLASEALRAERGCWLLLADFAMQSLQGCCCMDSAFAGVARSLVRGGLGVECNALNDTSALIQVEDALDKLNQGDDTGLTDLWDVCTGHPLFALLRRRIEAVCEVSWEELFLSD